MVYLNLMEGHYSTTMKDLDVLLSLSLTFNVHVPLIHHIVKHYLLLGLLNVVVWILKILFVKRYCIAL